MGCNPVFDFSLDMLNGLCKSWLGGYQDDEIVIGPPARNLERWCILCEVGERRKIYKEPVPYDYYYGYYTTPAISEAGEEVTVFFVHRNGPLALDDQVMAALERGPTYFASIKSGVEEGVVKEEIDEYVHKNHRDCEVAFYDMRLRN